MKDIDFVIKRKRQHNQSSQQSNKKPNIGPTRVEGHQKLQVPQIQQAQQEPLQIAALRSRKKPSCKECNRPHSGICMMSSFKCFYCKEEGHQVGDCLKKKKLKTDRAFVMHTEETGPDTT